jgi:hypothetical protein
MEPSLNPVVFGRLVGSTVDASLAVKGAQQCELRKSRH